MSLHRHLTSHTATSPRLRLGSRINASPKAVRTLAAEHPNTPLRELVPVASESSITLRVAPGWRAIYALAPDGDGAPFVAAVRFESESGPPRRAPATVRRQAVSGGALAAARELFDRLYDRRGAAAIKRHGFDLSGRPGGLLLIASTRSSGQCSPRSRPPAALVSSWRPQSSSASPESRFVTASTRPATEASSTARN